MKHYVLGFAFDGKAQRVVLIRMGPDSLFPGRWNGLGGKIEKTDDGPEMAMEREFREESGVQIDAARWEPTIRLLVVARDTKAILAKVICYRATLTEPEIASASKAQDVFAHPVNNLSREIVPNLDWLVPMHVFNETYYGEVYEVVQPFHAKVVEAQGPTEPA